MTYEKIFEFSRWWMGHLTLLAVGACAFDHLNGQSFSKKLNAGGEGGALVVLRLTRT